MALPIQNTSNSALLESARFSKKQGLKRKESVLLQLKLLQNNIYTSIDQLDAIIIELKNLVLLSKSRETEEEKTYKQGRLPSLFMVINAQNQTLSAILNLEQQIHQRLVLENQRLALEDRYLKSYKIRNLE